MRTTYALLKFYPSETFLQRGLVLLVKIASLSRTLVSACSRNSAMQLVLLIGICQYRVQPLPDVVQLLLSEPSHLQHVSGSLASP